MSARSDRILKCTPGRPLRRLHLLHRGHVELEFYSSAEPTIARLVAWGYLERHTPVDFLDAYDGYRPTKAGQKYLLYKEEHHLLMLRRQYVTELQDKASKELMIELDMAMVPFWYEWDLAVKRGWTFKGLAPDLEGEKAAITRYEARGYMTLDRFQTMYKLNFDDLIVCGVIRYLEHRDPDKMANVDVGAKARHCLLCSTRWQTFFVRPGMADELYALCGVEVRWL